MNTKPREFTTPEGRKVELIGATTKVQVWIDGKLYRSGVRTLRAARNTALDYSRRHGEKAPEYPCGYMQGRGAA